MMATRYGKLPTEILSLDVDDFSLNTIVMNTGLSYEASVKRGKPMRLSRGSDDPMNLPRKLDDIFDKLVGKKAPKRFKART